MKVVACALFVPFLGGVSCKRLGSSLHNERSLEGGTPPNISGTVPWAPFSNGGTQLKPKPEASETDPANSTTGTSENGLQNPRDKKQWQPFSNQKGFKPPQPEKNESNGLPEEKGKIEAFDGTLVIEIDVPDGDKEPLQNPAEKPQEGETILEVFNGNVKIEIPNIEDQDSSAAGLATTPPEGPAIEVVDGEAQINLPEKFTSNPNSNPNPKEENQGNP